MPQIDLSLRIEDQVADPRIAQQHPLLAGVDVDFHEVAEGAVVVDIIGLPAVRIERDAGHEIEHHALEVGQLAKLAGGKVHRADEADLARKAERRDQAVGPLVDIAARHRAKALGAQMLDLGQRIGGKLGEVLLLEYPFQGVPFAPRIVERLAERAVELGRVEGRAVLVAAQPLHDLVRAVGQRQVGEEAGAVEIVVGADLEVDGDALALQAERRIELVVVADLGAEHHFVIAALRAAEAARHPGFEEHRRPFGIPARDIVPRRRQIIVEDRFRMLLDRHRLAGQPLAPEGVPAGSTHRASRHAPAHG